MFCCYEVTPSCFTVRNWKKLGEDVAGLPSFSPKQQSSAGDPATYLLQHRQHADNGVTFRNRSLIMLCSILSYTVPDGCRSGLHGLMAENWCLHVEHVLFLSFAIPRYPLARPAIE